MSLIPFPLVYNQPMEVYQASRTLRHSLCKYLEPETAPCQAWYHSYLNPNRPGGLAGSHINTGNLIHDALEDYPAFCRHTRVIPHVKRTKHPGCIGGARGGQLEALMVLRAKLLAIPDVIRSFEEGRTEVSLYARQNGVDIASRPDRLSPTLEIHWKFLSRMDCIGYQIDRLRYVECLSWYRRVRRAAGLPDIRQVMYLCETKAPYEIKTLEVSPYYLDQADAYGHRALTRFKRLLDEFGEAEWPDLRHQPVDIYTASAGSPLNNAIGMPGSFERRVAV